MTGETPRPPDEAPQAAPEEPPAAAPEQVSQATPEEPSRDEVAAEYVLGTLDAAERDAAEALIGSDAEFAALVRQWERRLGELHMLAGSADPPAAVWDAIKAKLPETPQSAAIRLPELPRSPLPPPPANVVDLTARLQRWRSVAAAAGAMAAMFALFIVTSAVAPSLLPDSLRPKPRIIVQATDVPGPPPPRFVAVLQRDATSPAFILTVDLAERSLTVRRVGAERQAGKSYELWLVSNKFPAPRSLGLVSGAEFTRSGGLAPYDPSTIEDATFAVSLEPEGGSPTGAPSNVMFLGKLIESTPPQGQPEGR
jgi:anti-sigma-K factor RskA